MRSFAMNAARLACALALGGAAIARGEDVAPTTGSFELSLGAGYGQGLGPVGSGVPRLQDMGAAGGTFTLETGWRLDPRWTVGAYGEFGYFGGGNQVGSNHAKSEAAGLQAQLHVMPDRSYDPWIGVGFGWRGYWGDRAGGTHELQGLDVLRARIGLDYRVSPTLAMGPVFGITVTDFLSEKRPAARGYSDVNDRKVDTFLFGGFAARFNLL